MNFFEITLLALALSADAFAGAVGIGLAEKKPSAKNAITVGLCFGFFQAAMPVVGFFAAYFFVDFAVGYSYYIAFALLAFVGGKMIFDALKSDASEPTVAGLQLRQMLILAVATSIDALAVGISFAFIHVRLPVAVLMIGAVTFCLSAVGVRLGNILGEKYKSKATFVGGAVLIALGVRILLEGL